jgi:hypothetical protein
MAMVTVQEYFKIHLIAGILPVPQSLDHISPIVWFFI